MSETNIAGKIAFVFPGQGAQYPGMGKEIAEHYPKADAVFNAASDALGYDMKRMCFEGTEEELKITENTQPAILTMSIAVLEAFKEAGIAIGVEASAFAGLSLGEYSALVASGGLRFEEAVKVVQKRGKFMQEAVPVGVGGMAAILGLENEKVIQACREASIHGIVEPANFNCPMQLVIAGEAKAVEEAVVLCKSYGAKKAVLLPVSAPFHTSLLKGAGEKLLPELKKLEIGTLSKPVVTNVDGAFMNDSNEIVDKLVRQVSNPVRWEDSIDAMAKAGYTHFIEIGPGNALGKFIKKIAKDVQVYNVENLESLNKTIEKLKEAGYGL